MMAMDPQQIAIKTIEKNVAVNAGAGTGKTKVLTERFIHILEYGNLEKNKEIESIVAITFTKKATQEMIDRIRKEIRKNFYRGNVWRKYYRDMEKANISTIHSFCAKILRENPIEANIDPLFQVLENYESMSLLNKTIQDVLNRGLENNKGVYELLRIFKKNNISFLIDDFYQLYNKARTIGLTFKDLKQKTLEYINSLEFEKEDISFIKDKFIYLMEKLPKNSKIFKLQTDLNWIKFKDNHYLDEELPSLLAYLYENIGTSSKETENIDMLKSSIEKSLLGCEKYNIHIYMIILDLLMDIDKEYESKKKEIKALDYDDLQIKVLDLLENTYIRNKYQEIYKYIMIDEFQDTNELQKKIFYKLATVNEKLDRSNLFVVGDPKQSIYGFRGADLDVFYDVMLDIQEVSKEEIITLQKNYRTVETVLKFINSIFSKLMTNKYTELKEFHKSKNSIDVEILEKEDLEVPDNQSPSNYHRHYEAQLIAKRIKELVLQGKYKYGDFAMLFRATTRNHIYEEALKNFGVPFYNLGGKRFFLQQEVLDLINGLKSIGNPFDTIATIGFLRSPMIGLTDKTIYWILRNKKTTVYNAMVNIDYDEKINAEEEKIKEAINIMDYLYNIRDLYGLTKLLDELISKTYFIETLLLKQGGKQCIANIYKFKDMAKKYELNFRGTVTDFIDYLEEIKTRDEEEGKIESEDADVVKILTIHKSKGLQFPVVIIPEMANSNGGTYPNMLFHKEVGIGVQLENNRALYDNIRKELYKKDKEETERILYVAMTRAEKMLILGSQGKDSGFKKLIKDFINPTECKIISEVHVPNEEYIPVRLINNELVNQESITDIELPLLFKDTNYPKDTIDRYNITQYLTFLDCNRKFYFDYYRKLSHIGLELRTEKEQIISSIQKGNIIHKFCQYYKLDMDVEELLRNICKSFGIYYTSSIYGELKLYIENYLKLYNEDYDKTFIEKTFYLKLKDKYITGVIDRINIKGQKAEIVDYKTNKVINKHSLMEYYKPQLQLYSYVVKNIMDIEIHKTNIIFLENGESIDIPVDNNSLRENIYWIERFMDFTSRKENIYDYEKSNRCPSYCKYKGICDLE